MKIKIRSINESILTRGCQRCNFVLQSALNFVNLKWQVEEYICRLRSKKPFLEVAMSKLPEMMRLSEVKVGSLHADLTPPKY